MTSDRNTTLRWSPTENGAFSRRTFIQDGTPDKCAAARIIVQNSNKWTKPARGEYDVDKAVVLWGYLVESGAKKYAKEHSPTVPWHVLFPVPLRREVARALARDFESEAGYGNYDHLLPKKYQQARASVAAPALTRARLPKRAAQARSGRELDRDIAEAVTRSTRVASARRARRH